MISSDFDPPDPVPSGAPGSPPSAREPGVGVLASPHGGFFVWGCWCFPTLKHRRSFERNYDDLLAVREGR